MIRLAKQEDFDNILDLGRRMQSEGWFLTLDPVKARHVFDSLISDPRRGLLLVNDSDGQINGFFAAAISEPWYSSERYAHDVCIFVSPDRRGGLVAANFISWFIEWADAQGVAEKQIAISSGVRIEETGRLIERFGFTRVGGVYKQKGAPCVTA